MTKVSIVMAAYNEEAHIAAAIRSILAQTHSDWELVLVDDGSIDRTSQIIQDYKQKDSRIVSVRNQANSGLPESLNIGINTAKYDLIARADADDVNLPTRIEKQVHFLNQHRDIDAVGTGAYLVDNTGRRVRALALPLSHEEIVRLPFMKTIFFHPSLMLRKSFFKRHGFYDPSYFRAEDKELWLRGLVGGARYANISEPLIEYRTDGYIRSWSSLMGRAFSLFKMLYIYKPPNGRARDVVISLVVSVFVKFGLYKPKSLRS